MLNAGSKVAMLVGAGALRRPGRSAGAWPKRLASPIVKTLPGKAVVPDDHPLYDRRDRAPRHRAGHGRHGGVRHPLHGGDELPVHEVPARVRGSARWCRSRPTPSGPATGSPPTCPMIGDAEQDSRRVAAPRTEDVGPVVSRDRHRERWPSWRDKMTPSSRSTSDPIQPQHLMACHRPARRRRRHLDLRLGDHRHLGGTPLHHPGRARSSTSRATSPPWPRACPTRSPTSRPSGPPVHRLRRRRRVRHAHGRVRHGVPLRAPDQGDRQQQRLAGPDHVGAARARLSRIRHPLRRTARLRAVGPGVRRDGHPGRQGWRPRGRHHRGAAPIRDRHWSM